MKAMILQQLGSLHDNRNPLEPAQLPRPVPEAGEILLQVSACGVCHTELDEIEGRTPPPRLPIVLGHQVVGTVVERGAAANRHQLGDRLGVGWIFRSDGSPRENLSAAFQATGRDANGGYAEFIKVHEDYAFAIPAVFSDQQAAPLLCAGSIGFRALRLTGIENGQRLGLSGFGGSAHLVIQLARHQFPDSEVFVFARNEQERAFAIELGAAWAGDTAEVPPHKLQAVIDTTPAWKPVVTAMRNLLPGGRLVINAIRKQENDKDSLLELNYTSDLWMERELKSVANITGHDIAGFLPIAGEIPILPTVQCYPLADANRALWELKTGAVRGAKVLTIES